MIELVLPRRWQPLAVAGAVLALALAAILLGLHLADQRVSTVDQAVAVTKAPAPVELVAAAPLPLMQEPVVVLAPSPSTADTGPAVPPLPARTTEPATVVDAAPPAAVVPPAAAGGAVSETVAGVNQVAADTLGGITTPVVETVAPAVTDVSHALGGLVNLVGGLLGQPGGSTQVPAQP